MTDRFDFEGRLEARLVALTADVVRPFDAAAISASAAAAGTPPRTWGPRPTWRSRKVGLTPLVAALLLFGLLVALIGALLFGGSRPTLPAVFVPNAPPTSGPSPHLAPTGYPGTGTIAFGRVDPTIGGTATWLIDPDGSHESPYRVVTGWGGATGLPGSGCCAVISPNGRSIAVGYDEVNPTRGPGTWATTEVLDLEGSELTSIPVFCGGCASLTAVNYVPRAWSPNGDLVAVEVWNDANRQSDSISLAPTCTTSCVNGPYTCAPSGCDWDGPTTGIHRDVPIAFSPDGTKLLFVRISHDRLGALMVLTMTERGSGGFPPPPGAVRQISPAGTLVYADGTFGPPASWAPDGSQIAFAATDASGDVQHMSAYVVASAGGSPIPLTAAGEPVRSADWSPDGTRIAYDRSTPGTGTHDLFVIHPDGTGETNLTSTFDPSICCARWAPDSTALLAAGMVTDSASDLFIVPISGASIYQVTTAPGLYTDFAWGPASR